MGSSFILVQSMYFKLAVWNEKDFQVEFNMQVAFLQSLKTNQLYQLIYQADSKKLWFSKPPILEIFSQKFHGLVLGLVVLIDGKGIDVAQPIWSWDCLT